MTLSINANAIPQIKDYDPAGAELLLGLQAMVPALRERSGAAEAMGRIPEETIEELKALGTFKAAVPKRYGGLDLPYPYIPQIFRILGRGCSSTAWCMGFLAYNNLQFGHFSLRAQDEVWGKNAYAMPPGQVIPSGKATKVEGGYRLSGRWGYATGINHADWMLVSSATDMGDGEKTMRRFFVEVEQFKKLDTWQVVGMGATGSHDVELEEAFVPDHRSILVSDLREMKAEGLQYNEGPAWRLPLVSVMVMACVGPFIGAAEALVDIVTEVMKTKANAYTGEQMQGLTAQKIRLSRQAMRLDALIRLWEGHIEEMWEQALRGETPSKERRAEIRAVTAHVAHSAYDIINELARCVGTRSFYDTSPIQRFHRDMSSLSTHALFDIDSMAGLYGGARLGQELPENAMI